MSLDWAVSLRGWGDGDNVRAILYGYPVEVDHGLLIVPQAQGIGGKPPSIRLIHLDTPEKGHPDYYQAKGDLMTWLLDHEPYLRVQTYEKDTFGRYLGDVYDSRDRGNTATQYMLRRGWLPWKRSAALFVPDLSWDQQKAIINGGT